jgi:hypothetical protein
LELAETARRFERFATVECRGLSPLYERFALLVARDEDCLRVAAHATAGQPPPNLLFGAVRLLLFREPSEPLAATYARVALGPVDLDRAAAEFRDVCRRRADELTAIVGSRRVQTNEVGRTAFLRPALLSAAEAMGADRIALVELGTSAGLNLVLDRYAVRYARDGRSVVAGDPSARIVLDCELRGPATPPTGAFPAVAARTGVDVAPIDVRDPAAALWLRALVWPDNPGRERTLLAAIEGVAADPPPIRRGEAGRLLPEVLEALPKGCATCVYHSAFWYQLPPDEAARIEAALALAARSRPLAHVAVTSPEGRTNEVHVTVVGKGPPRRLARAHTHGAWLEWEGP